MQQPVLPEYITVAAGLVDDEWSCERCERVGLGSPAEHMADVHNLHAGTRCLNCGDAQRGTPPEADCDRCGGDLTPVFVELVASNV